MSPETPEEKRAVLFDFFNRRVVPAEVITGTANHVITIVWPVEDEETR